MILILNSTTWRAQFQISLKVPLAIGLFGDRMDLYGAYTNRSFWQMYNSGLFRAFPRDQPRARIMGAVPQRLDHLGIHQFGQHGRLDPPVQRPQWRPFAELEPALRYLVV